MRGTEGKEASAAVASVGGWRLAPLTGRGVRGVGVSACARGRHLSEVAAAPTSWVKWAPRSS